MSQKNETLLLTLSFLVLLGLLGIFGFIFAANSEFLQTILPQSGTSTSSGSNGSNQPNPVAGDPISSGEQSLVAAGLSAAKQQGIAAIAQGDYDAAVTQLEAALQENRNDPEALIYLNNARIGNQRAYSIAVAAPVSSAVDPALEMLRGVAQAQTEVNLAQDGIDGIPLKVWIADDRNDESAAQAVAADLVKNSEVLGVIGHFSSGVTLATEGVYSDGQLVALSPTSTSVKISGLSDYVFRTVPSDRFAGSALARHMLDDLGEQKVAVFFNSESGYSTSLKDEFTTAVFSDGGEVVAEFDLVASGFSPLQAVEQSLQSGAEVLMLAANTPTLDPALQVVSVNRNRLSLLGGDSVYNPKTLQVGGADAVDMVVAVPWHILSDPQSEFVRASRQLWGGDVSWRTAMTYDAAQALIQALETNPTRQGVQQALATSSFVAEGATGPVKFLPSGDRNQAPQLVTVEAGNRSGFGYDFVPIP